MPERVIEQKFLDAILGELRNAGFVQDHGLAAQQVVGFDLAQPLDIATQGSTVDLQSLAQFGAGPVATRLHQREQAEKTVGGAEHGASMHAY